MLAVRFLRKSSPGLRLIVSYADASQGHHGGIYQAMNWIYTGPCKSTRVVVHGQVMHGKTASSRYGKHGFSVEWLKQNVDPEAARIDSGDKHRYLLPLDDAMRAQVAPLAKPYPKPLREKQAMTGSTSTAAVQRRPSRSIIQTARHHGKARHPHKADTASDH